MALNINVVELLLTSGIFDISSEFSFLLLVEDVNLPFLAGAEILENELGYSVLNFGMIGIAIFHNAANLPLFLEFSINTLFPVSPPVAALSNYSVDRTPLAIA